MKLVNETRQSSDNTRTVQPAFDTSVVKSSIDEMIARGGYFQSVAGTGELHGQAVQKAVEKIHATEGKVDPAEIRAAAAKFDREYSVQHQSWDDASYMAAVESGNSSLQESMVRQAARAAGYTTPMLYHGTNRFGFTQYDLGQNTESKGMIYATFSPEVAATYSGSRDKYAFLRNINRKLRANTSADNVAYNARNIFSADYHVATAEERKAAIDQQRARAQEIDELLADIYQVFSDLPGYSESNLHAEGNPWSFSPESAISAIENLFYTMGETDTANDNMFDDNIVLDEGYRTDLQDAVKRFGEVYNPLRDYLESHVNEMSDNGKRLYKLFTGHKLFDSFVNIASAARAASAQEVIVDPYGSFRTVNNIQQVVEENKDIGAYKMYGNPGNNVLTVDADGSSWLSIEFDGIDGNKYHNTDSIAKWAREQGYTAVLFKNVYDGGGKSNEYVFFNADQVKSADNVTYDDNGDPVPLSKRFDSGSNDIRFQKWDGIEEAAEEHFGTTEDFNSAGYILKNGKMLDFSGRHWGLSEEESKGRRDVDHEDIAEAFDELGYNSSGDNRKKFISRGNIRISPEAPGINIYSKTKLTAAQYSVLRDFISEHAAGMGKFYVDIEDDQHRVGKLNYTGNLNADRIINDIKNFYATGEIRDSSVSQFHNQYQKWISDELTEEELRENELAINRLKVENTTLNNTIKDLNKQVGKLVKDAEKAGRKITDLKRELDKNAPAEVREKDAAKLAAQTLRSYHSSANRDEITKAIKAMGDYILQNPGEVDESKLRSMAEEIAKKVIDSAYGVLEDPTGEKSIYKEIASVLKGTTFNLPFDRTGELDSVNGVNAFRRKQFGRFSVKVIGNDPSTGRLAWTSDMRSIDSYYKELQQTYGEHYLPDVNTEGEMLLVFADIFDQAKDEYGNPFAVDYDEHLSSLANSLMQEAIDGSLRAMEPTFAQKQEARYNKLKAESQQRLEKMREEKNRRIADTYNKGVWMREQAVDRERAARYKEVEALKAKYQRRENLASEHRKNTKMRDRIRKMVQDLNSRLKNPTEKHYVPRELVNLTVDILNMIDMDTGTGNERLEEKLARLRTMYEGYKQNPTYSVVYDDTTNEMLRNLQQIVGDTPLNKMNSTQLTAVLDTLKSLDHVVRNAIKVRINNEERNSYEVASEMMNETREVNIRSSNVVARAWRHFLQSHLRASSMFSWLGGFKQHSMWNQVYQMLDDGQLKQTQITMKLSTPFYSLVNDEKGLRDFLGMNAFGKITKDKLVDIGLKDESGSPILVTHDIMIGIYMDLLNDENRRHFMHGGKTIPNLGDFYANRNDRGFGVGSRRAVGVSQELSQLNHDLRAAQESLASAQADNDAAAIPTYEAQVAQIQSEIDQTLIDGERYAFDVQQKIESLMTDYDRKWVAATQQLMNVDSKSYLNETTMDVYGIEKASVQNYFPITTDKNFLNSPFETITRDMNLENVGFMKQRIVASNPTMAMGTFSVVNNQIDRVAQYCGLMPAIRNFNKIYNKTAAGYSDSLKAAINSKFGSDGLNYVENLIADLTGSRGEPNGWFENAIGTLRGNLAKTTLTLNPRVALSQASSYPTAAAVIGYKPLLKALMHGGKNNTMFSGADIDKIAQYSPLLWKRMQGYSDIELGDIRNSQKNSDKIWRKLKWATGWIQAVDGATVGRLWSACEYYVQENGGLKDDTTSKTFEEEVAKVFNKVIEETQPNYTTMQRAAILRDPSSLKKVFTMFMTQRLQNFNILFTGVSTYTKARADYANKRNGVTKSDVKVAKQQMSRAVTSQLAAAATYVTFKLLADALLHNLDKYRDDDTGELTPESISLQLMNQFAESLIGMVLLGSELYSMIKALTGAEEWYGLSISGIDSVNDMIDNFVTLTKTDFTDEEKRNTNILKFSESLSQAMGIPMPNARKIVNGMVNHVKDAISGQPFSFESGYERDSTQEGARLLEALQAGDKETATDLIGSFATTDKMETALEKSVKAGYVQPGNKQTITKEQAIQLLVDAGEKKDDAKTTVQQWTCELATGIAYDQIDDQLIAGKITEQRAQELYRTYGSMDAAKAKQTTSKYMFQKETGYSWSDREEALYRGVIDDKTLAKYVQKIMTDHSSSEKASQYVRYLHFQHDYPAYDSLSESKVNDIYDLKATGITMKEAIGIMTTADSDGNGSLKQDEIGAYLKANGYNATSGQKIWSVFWNKPSSKTYATWLSEQ